MDYNLDFREGYVDTSLGKIHFRRHEAGGRKLLFIHGLGGTTKAWSRLMSFMPAEFDITLLDLLGHGKSDSPKIEYRIGEQVQALMEFISAQNIPESCIVGHSYGGWIAAAYASNPYPAGGIVLVDSAGLEAEEEAFVKMLEGHEYKEKFIRELLTFGNNEGIMRKILSVSQKEELSDAILQKIKKRTLIVWGKLDDRVNVKYAFLFNQKISGSELEIIENAGHDPHYTTPERFAELVIRFVK
ncbi:MAG: alpha/beta hydrolase [Candidatus Micrarchaeota archaeon]|nr:alpha/beta hydrolase [Candidatus Micrarchaeota archaeon]